MKFLTGKFWVFFCGGFLLAGVIVALPLFWAGSGRSSRPQGTDSPDPPPLLEPGHPLPDGTSEARVVLPRAELHLATYKPTGYVLKQGPLILVFHGLDRNAAEYRDAAIPLADRLGALVVAPRFGPQEFPVWRYARGGIVLPYGTVAPRENWTFSMVPNLVAAIREAEGRSDLPCYYLGHSAGGQFVERMAAFVGDELDGRRLVAANPGSDLFPTRELPYPYGFGGLPDRLAGDRVLRNFLAQPLTIYLGSEDTLSGPNLDPSPEAMRQGSSRLERGKMTFATAQRLARDQGWPCNWRLVIAQGVGHDHAAMFAAPEAEQALFAK